MVLKRPRHPMPAFVREALEKNKLMDNYKARPDYQQNDYIGRINMAKRDETKQRRLQQMLDELTTNDKYMKMPYKKSVK